jgi:hypothetical protein
VSGHGHRSTRRRAYSGRTRRVVLVVPLGRPAIAGDACDRCGGRTIVPAVPGDYTRMIPCPACSGTGRRGGRSGAL